MKKTSKNNIEIDKSNFLKQLDENYQYEDNNIIIKPYESESEEETEKENPNSYLTEITKNNTSFIGFLDSQFKRKGYGLINYENGDKYLGYFENDNRNKNGIYIWFPEIKNKKISTQCYYGNWKNNKKEESGMYIWLSEPIKNTNFDEANFECFIGEFQDDSYKRGSYLIKEGDDYYLYHGNFDREGKKSDDFAFFYSSKNDTLFHGRISKDAFRSGYILIFDSDSGNVKEMAYCNFDKSGNLIDSTLKNNLLKKDREKEEKKLCNFRNVILNEDYFGYIYDKYKEINNFINHEIDTIDTFEDKDKVKKIIKLYNDYNSNNIYKDIENNIFNKFFI